MLCNSLFDVLFWRCSFVFLASRICLSSEDTVFVKEFSDVHIIYMCLNPCIYHKKARLLSHVLCHFSTEFTDFWGIDYSIEISSHFLRMLVPKRLQNDTKKFQKIIKISIFVARGSFWDPLVVFGLHFCLPGHPLWLHYGR